MSQGNLRAQTINAQVSRKSSTNVPYHHFLRLSSPGDDYLANSKSPPAASPQSAHSSSTTRRSPIEPLVEHLPSSANKFSVDPSSLTKRKPPRTRSSSNEFGTFRTSKFLFTPAEAPVVFTPRSTIHPPPKKSNSSPYLPSQAEAHNPLSLSYHNTSEMQPESEDDRDDDEAIYTSWRGSSGNLKSSATNLRSRNYSGASLQGASRSRDENKAICTTPGHVCAGETETEIDEPSRQLPTSRIVPASGPLIPPNTLQQRLTPLLFEFARLLSIVPAVFGTLYNVYHIYHPPTSLIDGRTPPERIDFFISALWTILTGYQCLALATGLLTRWRLYYPPLATLVRLLALQGICWPGTHFTLQILEHEKRPVVVWAVVGTFTCFSRSVQIWVTSNLWWEKPKVGPSQSGRTTRVVGDGDNGGYWRRWGGGQWGGRRWDWKEVGFKCIIPPGVVYFVMAWAEQLRREWSGC